MLARTFIADLPITRHLIDDRLKGGSNTRHRSLAARPPAAVCGGASPGPLPTGDRHSSRNPKGPYGRESA